MAKQTGVTRTTISVPRDLKKRMDKVSEPVNWSGIACRAFEIHLGDIAAKKENKKMSDVVQRLRASRKEADSEWFRTGREYGEKWARDHASYDELVRVVAVSENEDHPWEVNEQDIYSAAEILFFSIDGQEYQDRGDARDFWKAAVDGANDAQQQPEFLRGFVDGAADLFESIEDQI
jgi:hypothetical protein